MRGLWCWGLIGISLLVSRDALAQSAVEPDIVSARLGFDGYHRLGHWVPLEVVVRGGTHAATGALFVSIPDGHDTLATFSTPPSAPLVLQPQADTRTVLYVQLGRIVRGLDMLLVLDNGHQVKRHVELAEPDRGTALDGRTKLYLSLGASFLKSQRGEASKDVVVELSDIASLPTQWYGYDSVDLVVLNANQPERCRALAADPARLNALRQWVELGGRLLIVGGSEARETLAVGAPLAQFLPGTLAEVVTLRSASSLEQFSGSSRQIPTRLGGASIDLSVARLTDVRGVITLRDGDVPLVVQSPRGLGQITFFAADLDHRPLDAWEGRAAVVQRLLAPTLQAVGDDEQPTDASVQALSAGLLDIVSQLHDALDHFEGVQIVPFYVVGVALLGYIALIGPGDYWLVTRYFKRAQWTWITFPSLVVIACLAAYGVALWAKGTQVRVNQVDLVDLDMVSGQLRGTSWCNVFSPQTDRFDFSVKPQSWEAAETSMLVSWLGNPGDAWQGMHRPSGGALSSRGYVFAPESNALHALPIDIWSSRAITASWTTMHAQASATKGLKLHSDRALHGTLVNPFAVRLTDCVLAFDRSAYFLGTLEPGQAITLKPSTQRDLSVALREFVTVDNQKRSGVLRHAVPYNPLSEDIPTIVKTIMFYKASGGRSYTGLSNRAVERLDLSELLALDRAVLVGTGPNDPDAAPSQLLNHGRPLIGEHETRWGFYRAVMPFESERP